MSFFPPIPKPDPRRSSRDDAERVADPAAGELPGALGVSVSTATTPIVTASVAIVMDHFLVFREGFLAELRVAFRTEAQEQVHSFLDRPGAHPSDRLLWGLEMSDGRRGYVPHVEASDASFSILPKGGGGSSRLLRTRNWVYTIPSPGPMTLHLVWQTMGLDETSIHIDTDGIIEAAGRSGPVWGRSD